MSGAEYPDNDLWNSQRKSRQIQEKPHPSATKLQCHASPSHLDCTAKVQDTRQDIKPSGGGLRNAADGILQG